MRTPTELPADFLGSNVQITLKGTALARTVQALGSSFLINLNSATKFVRVYAISKDAYMKWAESDTDYCKADNFDEFIPAGQYIDFAVPVQEDGVHFSRLTFVGRESGSTIVVVEK